jgi:hypothetical protein
LAKISHVQLPFCLHHKIDQKEKEKNHPRKEYLSFFNQPKKKKRSLEVSTKS